MSNYQSVFAGILNDNNLSDAVVAFYREDEYISAHCMVTWDKLAEYILFLERYGSEDLTNVNFEHNLFMTGDMLLMFGIRLNQDLTLKDVRVELFYLPHNIQGYTIRMSSQMFTEVFPKFSIPAVIPYGVELSGDYIYHGDDQEILDYVGIIPLLANEKLELLSYNFTTNRLKVYYLTNTKLIGLEEINGTTITSEYVIIANQFDRKIQESPASSGEKS